jgi:hypothetical protein
MLNATILDEHLEFMRDQELAEEWTAAGGKPHAIACRQYGRTLEWYVVEWFSGVGGARALRRAR